MKFTAQSRVIEFLKPNAKQTFNVAVIANGDWY